ncbi:DNA cytosine methyltransferase [Lentzea chajnantorensis]
MHRYRAVSLFSGCGGFCDGVRLAGFSVNAAVESDQYAAQTYRRNFPEVPLFEGDICDFLVDDARSWQEQRSRFRRLRGAPTHLVFGGPPCQGFSSIGPRSIEDPRNQLYQQFIRVLADLRPSVFLMENVPNMLLIGGGQFKTAVMDAMADAGYLNAGVLVVSADEFGVAQTRRRAIFFGVRNDLDLGMPASDFLGKILDSQRVPTPTVANVLRDLPAEISLDDSPLLYPKGGRVSPAARELRVDRDGLWYSKQHKRSALNGPMLLHNHHTKGMEPRRQELVKHLQPGANGKSLPASVWSGTRAEKWRRLHPDRPSHTILAQMHRDMSEWVHPWLHRWITVREAARLQSFHDGFVFESSEWQMLKQVGNAVPPLMARALATVAKEALDRVATSTGRRRRTGA